MAYYQGDYYQGDYYQGDPFLGGLIAKGIGFLAKKIFKRKLTTGGMTALQTNVSTGLRRAAPVAAGAALAFSPQIPIPFTRMQVSPTAFLPGGQPFVGPRRPAAMAAGGAQICCPSGFHPNKQTSTARATMGAEPGTICVRNRTMNVANPRALRRGLRRVAGFGKLAMRSKKDVRRAAKALGA